MRNRQAKIIAIMLLTLASSAALALPQSVANPVNVSFYVGDNSTDQEMDITGFTATGDTDCSQPIPTPGPGVCKDVLDGALTAPIACKYGAPCTLANPLVFLDGLKATSADWDKDVYATGTVTLNFKVTLGPNSFTITEPIHFTEGILDKTGIPQIPGTANASCSIGVIPAATKGTASAVTFSCWD